MVCVGGWAPNLRGINGYRAERLWDPAPTHDEPRVNQSMSVQGGQDALPNLRLSARGRGVARKPRVFWGFD